MAKSLNLDEGGGGHSGVVQAYRGMHYDFKGAQHPPIIVERDHSWLVYINNAMNSLHSDLIESFLDTMHKTGEFLHIMVCVAFNSYQAQWWLSRGSYIICHLFSWA